MAELANCWKMISFQHSLNIWYVSIYCGSNIMTAILNHIQAINKTKCISEVVLLIRD